MELSIIIPVYNIESYLSKCIDSVLNQTKQNFDIILVDDGSTDSSGDICDSYARQDSRIKVIHKENGGLSSARNAGTQAAKTEYVMFLDGDDYLRGDAVERLLSVASEYPSDIIQFQYLEVGGEDEPTDTDNDGGEIYRAHTPKELFYNLYKLGGVAASGATKLMKRELALKIPFENVQHEDEMWCTRAFKNGLSVTYIPYKLYCYVMRESSIIHSTFNRRKLDIFKVCEERIATLKALGLSEFLSNEYSRLFSAVIRLYVEAENAGCKAEAKEIKSRFSAYKNDIDRYASLQGKYKLLFNAMLHSFNSIELYRLYGNMKGKSK